MQALLQMRIIRFEEKFYPVTYIETPNVYLCIWINNTTIMEESKKHFYGPIPRVLNEDILSFLCNKHKGEIGLGSKKDCPRMRIRYVMDKNRFGYADFGDFFFWEDGGLYVWQQSEEFEEDHHYCPRKMFNISKSNKL